MPFYDGMGTYFLGKWCSGVEKTIKNTVVLLVSNPKIRKQSQWQSQLQ